VAATSAAAAVLTKVRHTEQIDLYAFNLTASADLGSKYSAIGVTMLAVAVGSSGGVQNRREEYAVMASGSAVDVVDSTASGLVDRRG
jgi:hypothetical protein